MALQIAGSYLAEVHVKNTRFDPAVSDEGFTVFHAVSAPVDAGVVDWLTVIKELKTAGYDGWLFFEDFSEQKSLEKRLRHNIEYFRRIMR
jgi:sugar phosphate isomerase/epimerase